ncbi:MAG: SMI1/KNR4 family protein [Leptolyngbyaceae cyanobacterium MO_188.B28]|nr:SMI1/KNR4 family protein [Leptolyngbyaceae cyanobacterium MO_188.B28]
MDKIDSIMARLGSYPIQLVSRRDPTELDLRAFEQELGGSLPFEYSVFLSQYGQTALSRGARFFIRESNPWGSKDSLDQFFGFSTDPSQDIVNLTMQTYAGRIPDETIPIGSDAGGNLILLGFDALVENQVFFWDHKHRELDGGRLADMATELESKGIDTCQLDAHSLIWHWEQTFPEQLVKPAGYSNVYAVANNFMEFLESLQPEDI